MTSALRRPCTRSDPTSSWGCAGDRRRTRRATGTGTDAGPSAQTASCKGCPGRTNSRRCHSGRRRTNRTTWSGRHACAPRGLRQASAALRDYLAGRRQRSKIRARLQMGIKDQVFQILLADGNGWRQDFPKFCSHTAMLEDRLPKSCLQMTTFEGYGSPAVQYLMTIQKIACG